MQSFAKRKKLYLGRNGWIQTNPVARNLLPSAITNVATASKEAAHHLLDHFRPRVKKDFRIQVRSVLLSYTKDLATNVPLIGASNRQHKFDFVMPLPQHRRLVIDAVVPDMNSISSAIVSHLDLRQSERSDIEQRIVYDETDSWASSDIQLLSAGARPVAFGHLNEVVAKIAA
jgi:hypothetical protein